MWLIILFGLPNKIGLNCKVHGRVSPVSVLAVVQIILIRLLQAGTCVLTRKSISGYSAPVCSRLLWSTSRHADSFSDP